MAVRFGECSFDLETRELFRGGESVALSPKAFRLLEVLIRRRPKAISKEELQDTLWPQTFVSEGNLARLMAELREAIGDDAREPHFLRTIHGFGYAFSGSAEEPRGSASAGAGRPFVYRLIFGDREIALGLGENLLGRDEGSVVWIDESSVSRRHARIVIDESGAVLEDLGSKNGTYLRGKRIRGSVKLADEDLFRVGSASMILRVFKGPVSTASAIEE